jgi:hypothetical protein
LVESCDETIFQISSGENAFMSISGGNNRIILLVGVELVVPLENPKVLWSSFKYNTALGPQRK